MPLTELFSRLWRSIVAPALLLIALAACRAPEPQPLIFGDAPWVDGEVSVYQVTDLNGAYAGTARYDMTRLDDTTWNLRRETSAQGTQEIVVVDMSVGEYRPRQATLVRIDADGSEQVRTRYEGTEANLELTSKQNITTYQRVNIPSDARDRRTLPMLVRALPLAAQYATRINSFLPIVPVLDRVTLSVTGREEVQVPVGVFDAWRVLLDTGDSQTQLWVGVDAPHPLVKYEDGRNQGVYELVEYQPGP